MSNPGAHLPNRGMASRHSTGFSLPWPGTRAGTSSMWGEYAICGRGAEFPRASGFLTEFFFLRPNGRGFPAGWTFVIITLHLWGPYGPFLCRTVFTHRFMVSLPRAPSCSSCMGRISLNSAIFLYTAGLLLFVLCCCFGNTSQGCARDFSLFHWTLQ